MAKANPLRFSTKYQDEETDLLYYGYRYYSSSVGSWLGRDPKDESGFLLVASRKQYRSKNPASEEECISQFVRNNPLNSVDFIGLKTIHILAAGDSSGVIFDVYNLGGMDHQVEALKQVLRKCPCGGEIDVDVRWYFDRYYLGPEDARWDLGEGGGGYGPGTTVDWTVLRNDWQLMWNPFEVPVLLTGFDIIVRSVQAAGLGAENQGIVLNAGRSWYDFYVGSRVLAHELGHFAGYDGGDVDRNHHSSKPSNIMYKAAELTPGAPDTTYCAKVLSLAR